VFSTGVVGIDALRTLGVPGPIAKNLPFVLELSDYPERDRLLAKFETDHTLRFISSGRLLNKHKGHDLAIRALAEAFGPGCRWEYRIAGTGPDLPYLQSLAHNLGVADNVKFLGWVEPAHLVQLLSDSHVLLHPSPIHDPYPNAVLEGMAAACIVMASDACGSAVDRVTHGRSGFLHKAADWRGLAEQIRDLDELGNQRATIALSARKTAENWTIERSTEQLLAAIHDT
jgi:glycosyltransferase involved in cell wall biosynthesis